MLKAEAVVDHTLTQASHFLDSHGDLIRLQFLFQAGLLCQQSVDAFGQKNDIRCESIVSRLHAAHYRGDLTFEVKLEGREGRHEHDAYRALSFFGYASLARERAERLRKMFFAKQP